MQSLAAARAVFSSRSGPGFAPGNRIQWLCRHPGANLAAARAGFPSSSGPGFALGNRIYCLCRHPGANLVAARTGRGSRRRHKKKGKQRFRKSKSLLPLFWGLIDRIHFLYGFIPYETPSAMLSSCEGSLPGSHMRTGTALPFP